MVKKPTLSGKLRQRHLLKQLKWVALSGAAFLIVLSLYLSLTHLSRPENSSAQSATSTVFQGGSFIINMGWTPQDIGKGLKPYGLVYDLVVNSGVPVAWVINPSKLKDGIDFTHENYVYKGGTFVIPAEYITPVVANKIVMWQLQGVLGRYAVTSFTAPMYEMITSYPRVMIDSLSGLQNVIISYFQNAGIPSSAYSIGAPATLTSCFDVWANPHGDPVWATHSPLYNFVTQQKGYIYAQCHSVSMMENSVTGNPITNQLNFLSTNGLKCWKSNGCEYAPETHSSGANTPYTYNYPADPVMQFMGTMHSVSSGGSEQYYIPLSTGGWRATTRVGVSTGDGIAPRQGTVLVYGPAYGNENNGHALYIGGHTLVSGTATDQIAAQRAFHNFLLKAGIEKELQINAQMPPDNMSPGGIAPVSVTVTNGSPGYTYQWTSSMGGTFTNASAANTVYTSPTGFTTDTFDIVRIRVTDSCGRMNIITKVLRISGSTTLPVRLLSFSGQKTNEGVMLKWSTASETNSDYFFVERSTDSESWTHLGMQPGAGNSNSINFYYLKDREPSRGMNYYRLSQVDFDGHKETYRTINLMFDGSGGTSGRLNIHNSLFSDGFRFEAESVVQSFGKLKLFDSTGRLADERVFRLNAGSQVISYDDRGLRSGVYVVVFETEEGSMMISRVVKL
jgi:hypothetical protein